MNSRILNRGLGNLPEYDVIDEGEGCTHGFPIVAGGSKIGEASVKK